MAVQLKLELFLNNTTTVKARRFNIVDTDPTPIGISKSDISKSIHIYL